MRPDEMARVGPRRSLARGGGPRRRGTSVCQVARDEKELDLIAPDGACTLFLLSCGCDSSGYYRVAHGTALIPNEAQFPCQTLVARLTRGRSSIAGQYGGWSSGQSMVAHVEGGVTVGGRRRRVRLGHGGDWYCSRGPADPLCPCAAQSPLAP